MLSGPVAESELSIERTFLTFTGAKDTESRNIWVQQGRMGIEIEGLGTQDVEANTELKHSAFS